MFLLLLMGLGAASVKAQVRIGGNTPPNPAAALDLNAAEGTTTGTKGLALPRVTLGSNTATLDGTTANITGMLVYNTSGSLRAGIYYWDGSEWVTAAASSSGGVDTTDLAPAPANNSMLVFHNGQWRTATFDSIYAGSAMTATGGTATFNIPTTGCITKPVIYSGAPDARFYPWGVADLQDHVSVFATNLFGATEPLNAKAWCWRVH